MLYLVIPAGGSGIRMGNPVPKQFLDWGGEPLLMATINAFFKTDMPKIDGIAIALPPDKFTETSEWAFPVPHWCVKGGETRQESVNAAINILPDEPQAAVMIHDAVRPFPPASAVLEAIAAISPDTTNASVTSSESRATWDGAVLAEVSTDTLKRVNSDLRVITTEPRELIYRAQTPQLALLSTWKTAFEWAIKNDFQGTDDVSILEAMGLNVRVIPSPPTNQKITTPEDWARLAPRRTMM